MFLCLAFLHMDILHAQQEHTYEVDTKVLNEEQKPIAGALFYLYKDGGLYADNIQSDAQGNIEIKNLTYGNYALYQQASTYGYDTIDTHLIFSIDSETKSKQQLENIKNERLYGDVSIALSDIEGKKIINTKVAIQDEKGKHVRSVVSDNNGMLVITHIPIGTYYIKVIDEAQLYKEEDEVSFAITPYNYQKEMDVSIHLKKIHRTFKLQDYTFTIGFIIVLFFVVGYGIFYFRRHPITQFFDDFMV